ncbi:MAG: hypothetical protein ACI9R3_004956 [Verrucomicrobiales bacterium]|jgi:hypothetical protein
MRTNSILSNAILSTMITTPPLPPGNGHTAPTQQKKGKGCLIAGIIAAVILVIGGITVVGLGVWGYSKVKDNFSADPVKIEAMSNQIVDLDMAADARWQPKFALDMLIMKMAFYSIDEESAFLVVMNADPKVMGTGDAFESRMRSEIDKQNAQQGSKSGKSVEATTEISSSREQFVVQGTPRGFLVTYSEGVETKTRYIEVSGSLDSNESGRSAFIYLKAPEATVILDQAKALIESAQ